jgi:hypothetical protein
MSREACGLPPQYEDPDDVTSIALFKAHMPQANEPGAKVGGARILNFQKGWAMPILLIDARTAHWFVRRGEHFADSLCGLESILELIHGPGNYPKCGNCIKTMTRIKQGRTV